MCELLSSDVLCTVSTILSTVPCILLYIIYYFRIVFPCFLRVLVMFVSIEIIWVMC